MHPLLSIENLISADGEVNLMIYGHMVRRRAMAEHGGLSPLAIRLASTHYAAIVSEARKMMQQ